jgi:hypothetical protein
MTDLKVREGGRKRWLNVSAAARKAHAEMAVAAREMKRARERTEAQERFRHMPALILALKEARLVLMADGSKCPEDSGHVYYAFGHKLGAEHCAELGVNRATLAAWDGFSASKSLKAIFRDSAVVAAQVPMKRRAVFLRGLRDGAAGKAIGYWSHPPLTEQQIRARTIRRERRDVELERLRR